MNWFGHISALLFLSVCCKASSIVFDSKPSRRNNVSHVDFKRNDMRLDSHDNQLDFELKTDAQESANFFTSDLGGYDAPSDYGSFFENFPNLPYFPEFGEIFRISKTTTPQPPFQFPDYVRDPFPDRISGGSTASTVSGGRRPSRRPPRPASSGTRTKVTKQNQSEPKDKPRTFKSKAPNKSRNYPKIFRFNPDRVNLAEFDTKKKMNENYLSLAKGDELDFDKVKRNKFLILHGGVFEIERSRRRGLLHASTNSHPDMISSEDSIYGFSSNPK